MVRRFAGIIIAASMLTAAAAPPLPKPTIVLVHGAFADASSWNGVVKILERDGYPVVAVANPLRSVHGDARYVTDIVASIHSRVVLVGHSYGGSVISEAAVGTQNVKALVYVSAFAPEADETAAALAAKFPGSSLARTLATVPLSDGTTDLYIQQPKFRDQFAADVPAAEAKLMAAAQRPIAQAALNEPAGVPAWKTIPSWFVFGDGDRNIPARSLEFMADRARSKHTVVIRRGSHLVMVSHPLAVARLIEEAASIQ